MAKSVFDIITEKVVAFMEQGNIPWQKPWSGGNGQNNPCNISGRPYNGINFFLLSCFGYDDPIFLTFKQIRERKGTIKAGEEKNYFPVFFWQFNTYDKDKDGSALTEKRTIPMCRYYLVYNISQTDLELPEKFKTKPAPLADYGTVAAAERVIEGYENAPDIQMKDGSDQACYIPSLDIINIPHKNQFVNLNSYYSTLFHELIHSTGHSRRLNRKELMSPQYFGSHDYSQEELVAEMGAAFLCNHVGIDNTLENSAAYIKGWLGKLKSDPKMLMTAAGRAQKAFEHIAGKSEYAADEE